MNVPDLPLWAWVIVVILSVLALTLPFWMLIRLPYMKRIRNRAAKSGKESLLVFYVLAYMSYLTLVWLILWGYGAFEMF